MKAQDDKGKSESGDKKKFEYNMWVGGIKITQNNVSGRTIKSSQKILI